MVDDYAGAVAAAIDEARARVPEGALVEGKGLALTLHWRNAPAVAPAAVALARRIAERHGLAIRLGKRAVELVLPVANDKGTVVTSLLTGCAAGCVLGDDVGDIPAFSALDLLVRSGALAGVRVAVASEEAPEALLAGADVTVEGPLGALGFLGALADRAAAGPGTRRTGVL